MSIENFKSELEDSVGLAFVLTCDSCSHKEISEPDEYDSQDEFLENCYKKGWRYCHSEEFNTDCAIVCPSCMEDSEQDWEEK